VGILQHVVISGASSGLGSALAQAYSRAGNRLTLFGRDPERLAAVAEACRGQASAVVTVACDVTDSREMQARLAQADGERPVDILIANAGIGGREVLAPAYGESPQLARSILDINTLGVVNTVSPLLEAFAKRRRGHVVIISSVMAFQGLAEAPVYAASKAAVRTYGQGLRRLLAAHDIHVTVVCPGFIATPMSQSLPFEGPFMVSAEAAARRIVKGVARREREIVFPWQLKLLAGAAALLPHSIFDGILAAGRALSRPRSQ